MEYVLACIMVFVSSIAYSQTSQTSSRPTSQSKDSNAPLVVGPVDLNCINKPCSVANITGSARGSGVNGPATAQTGLTINFAKDNWWTGGKIGEVDGLNILVRQNAPHSDSSGILVNVQNQGHGFLSATEFSSTIVDPATNTLTYGIDVQEGVLDHLNGDYIGSVYTADYGALGTGVLIQNGPGASWRYAIQYHKDGSQLFSVDGAGNIFGSSAHLGPVALGGDPANGSVDIGNPANTSATPYIDLNGFGTSQNNVRMINDANGQLTISTITGGNLKVNANGVYTTGSFHVKLSTPANSSSPCTAGQFGADAKYVYVCVAANTWRRSALSSF